MKQFFGAIALCALLLPSVALAQSAPPMPPQRPDMAGMRQVFEQVEKIHRAERTQVLAALSPAHRELLASIVGNMAIAANPDHKAAAGRLDAALSSSEKSAVLAAHTSAMTQMHDAMHAMMLKRQAAQGGQSMNRPKRQHGQRHAPTAGEVVLMVTSGHGEMHGRMPFGPPPPGAPAPAST
jgi:hypothetical protein